MNTKIDWKEVSTADDFMDMKDKLQGIIVLLQGLECADEAGSHVYQRQGYVALSAIVQNIIDDTEHKAKQADYMFSKIHEFRDNQRVGN